MAMRTARDFSRRKIWEIATEYANTENEYSVEYFSIEYDISYSTFYTLLEKAVIENIVDERTVLKMAKKAAENAYEHAGKPAKERSKHHYKHLVLKRQRYMLPKEKAVDLVEKYANSELSKKSFALSNYIEVKLFDRVLYKAILENWVSNKTVQKLKEKSLKFNDGEKTYVFWDTLLYFRNENKKNQG